MRRLRRSLTYVYPAAPKLTSSTSFIMPEYASGCCGFLPESTQLRAFKLVLSRGAKLADDLQECDLCHTTSPSAQPSRPSARAETAASLAC